MDRVRVISLTRLCLVCLAWTFLVLGLSHAQFMGGSEDQLRRQMDAARAALEAVQGAPSRVALADEATIRLDGSLQFLEPRVGGRFLAANNKKEPEGFAGLFWIGGREQPWQGVISMVRRGFVDIDAIRRFSPDDLLASIRDEVARENKIRAASNLPPRQVTGWRIPPRYDPETKSLRWAVQSYVPGVS